MTITYEVDSGLYINVTNRCTNRCEFCIRNNADGAYGSDSLWLEHEPTVDEVLTDVFSRDLTKYTELVFCGYGEPTVRLNDIRKIALGIKKRYPSIKIRVNTNGHSDLKLSSRGIGSEASTASILNPNSTITGIDSINKSISVTFSTNSAI